MRNNIISLFAILFLLSISVKVSSKNTGLDVSSYHLTIEPNIEEESVIGYVSINFQLTTKLDSVVFASGDLEIDDVTGEHVIGFKKSNAELIIYLSERTSTNNEVIIHYHGRPKTGLIFDKENNQAYTVYFTSQWMPSNDSPADKALFYLDIMVPNGTICVASGELINRIQENGSTKYSFHQNYESPAYTFGFTIGNFNKAEEMYGEVLLKYYSKNYSSDQLMTIFRETPAMISFFEDKSGINYEHASYSQILIGNHYQEMSGFSVLKDFYGNLVIEDSTETNLISHELAHQWWGNRITCKSWNHFWLNEALVTYMSAAYNEYRFGQYNYNADINTYYSVYEDIKSRNKDRSLIYEDWSNPTRDDRNLIYFKGAYVLHLLRDALGDERFWNAIRSYSIKHFGKSVETIDFQKSIEESSGINLDDFFNKWVY